MSELLIVGSSHKTAPVELRERLSFTSGACEQLLSDLIADPAVQESAALSTCNRTEVYVATNELAQAKDLVIAELAKKADLAPAELMQWLYIRTNCDVARHLFNVTAGLEAMVVGESEIQGQVRRAYEQALAAGYTGPVTNRLFNAALATGKRVRSQTSIACRRRSVASVAVDLARQVLGELSGRKVVVLGAGEASELTARALVGAGVEITFTTNRRHAHALALAGRFGGRAVGFDRLPEELLSADIALGATSSPHALFEPTELRAIMQARQGRPLLLVDIAVPRDFDAGCKELEGVTLMDIDDLYVALEQNRSVDPTVLGDAQQIVNEELQRFAGWLGSLSALPTVRALHQRAKAIVSQVLADNWESWESLSERDAERLHLVTQTIVNRLLHEPTVRMKRTSDEHSHVRAEVLRDLFALDEAITPIVENENGAAAVVHSLARSSE